MLLLHPIDNWLFTSRTCQRVVFSCSLSFWAAACIRFSRCLVFLDCLYDSICNHILQDIFKHISHSLRFAQLTVSVLVHYHNDTSMRFVKIFSAFILWRFPCVLSAFNLRCEFILPCLISFNMARFRRHVLSVARIWYTSTAIGYNRRHSWTRSRSATHGLPIHCIRASILYIRLCYLIRQIRCDDSWGKMIWCDVRCT